VSLDRIVFARHLHTENHETPARRVSIDDLVSRYAKADAIIVEDHGVFQAPPSERPAGKTLVVGGCEWATPIHRSGGPAAHHHVGLLGVDRLEQQRLQIRGSDIPAVMRDKVHQANGALVLNHPEYPYIDKLPSAKALDYTLPLDEAGAFDAVEVFNDVGFTGSDPAQVLAWTERTFFARGLYPAVVGGQDDHGPSPVAKEPTYTMALVGARDEDGLTAAVRASHTYVSKSPDTVLNLRLDGVAVWERTDRPSPGSHTLSVDLANLPEGAVVEVVRKGEVVARQPASGGSASLSLPVTSGGTDPDYAYVRVWRAPGKLHTVSSPVPLA
jgi:hypothetical protein